MRITDIKESGCNNTLRWAISNNAEFKDNIALNSIINDELFYLITIENINFYELFRLSQLYRNKIKIWNINRAEIPSNEYLIECFDVFADEVGSMLELFTGLVAQMVNDSDIIAEGVPRLFLPMLTTTFTIQIPYSFIDTIEVMTVEECEKMFNSSYPDTLLEILNVNNGLGHSLIRAILVHIERSISTIKYDSKYEQLLKLTKYFALREHEARLFKTGLVGFAKYDPIGRGECRCSLFKPHPGEMGNIIKRIARIRSPLEISTVVQLPIYYMQILESSYFPEDLTISHRSSLVNTISNGLIFNNFNTENDNEDNINIIENYRLRILEANLTMLRLIDKMTADNVDAPIHGPSLFALLPSIYRTNAVLTFLNINLDTFTQHTDPVINDMFLEIQKLNTIVMNDIERF